MDTASMFQIFITLTLLTLGESFFLRWGSDSSQTPAQKTWVPAQTYRAYAYPPQTYVDQRKLYQQSYAPQAQAIDPMQQSFSQLQPIPISVPLQASLTPVSLQHVQLVPCMCPVAAEEADKLQEMAGPGPYLAQTTYTQASAQSPQVDQVNGSKP